MEYRKFTDSHRYSHVQLVTSISNTVPTSVMKTAVCQDQKYYLQHPQPLEPQKHSQPPPTGSRTPPPIWVNRLYYCFIFNGKKQKMCAKIFMRYVPSHLWILPLHAVVVFAVV